MPHVAENFPLAYTFTRWTLCATQVGTLLSEIPRREMNVLTQINDLAGGRKT